MASVTLRRWHAPAARPNSVPRPAFLALDAADPTNCRTMSRVPSSRAPLAPRHSAGRGIGLALLGGAVLTVQDAIIKWLTDDYSVGEILFYRGAVALLAVVMVMARRGEFRLVKTRNVRGHVLRNLFVLSANGLFVSALALMPLTDAVAITFTSPLFVTALAAPLLGERVGWRRWTAVAVGFSGVFVMLRPGELALQLAALLALGTALSSALRDIITRRMVGNENVLTIMFYLALTLTLAGLTTFPFGWRQPTGAHLLLLGAMGLLFGIGQYLMVQAFRFAEATVITPFRYVSLLWVTLLAFLVWGDVPDGFMVAGASLVVASGLYILHRETTLFRRRRTGARARRVRSVRSGA